MVGLTVITYLWTLLPSSSGKPWLWSLSDVDMNSFSLVSFLFLLFLLVRPSPLSLVSAVAAAAAAPSQLSLFCRSRFALLLVPPPNVGALQKAREIQMLRPTSTGIEEICACAVDRRENIRLVLEKNKEYKLRSP